ncbi:NADH:flavin oxidoreductase/NADH oxidase [Haloarcula pellucida]|uniref:Oxidoreductase n=1 Tax=Haloarcula pellucida TaxID=1427151 RepID=A0A830GLT2_9EURY|nr:NADH:flavin oxidoreductase/NADH oxidase [Halomicroarcula pellucida]MBX0348386.1 NADH:flavin oxidoreductase/NADH oxidase [Halomicroarcula pellucida]GGN93610.1 oxidoreductase [Halomicroarcula pellucida]
MTALFSPLDLRETTIPNRVMVSPMCQYSCENRDGLATDWHRTHLGSRAVGGAGLVMTEATAVEARGRISPADLGIWNDEHAAALEPITEFVRQQGSVPAIQLAHAGRKASTSRPWEGHDPLQPDDGGWETVGPSGEPWPYEDGDAPPTRKLDQDGIEGVVDSFRAAAERARDAGFEVAEVHAAHGYLLHEFCSPVTNHREDDYGGDFEGRTRLVREVTAAVREVWPDGKPVFVRISATDWLPERESWTVDDSVRLADHLAAAGADLIDVSGGGIHPDSRPDYTGPNYQLRYAERIREETDSDVAVGAVGGITTPEQAEAIVANDRADLAIVGREHLRDPYFAMHAAEALDATDEIEGPPQYRRAFGF